MKHKITLLTTIIFALCIIKINSQVNFQWAKSMGGSNTDDGRSVIIDVAGNIYTTGSFQGVSDFDSGSAIFNLTAIGNSDIFITKTDASGNFIWAKSMGGASFDIPQSISVDVSGNVYVTGYFEATVDFDPGTGVFNLTSLGFLDVFVSKLDASGNFVWARSMGGAGYDVGYGITVDGSGNIYSTGVFDGTPDFDPGVGIFNLTSAGFDDIFVSKLDASGNFVWAKSMGGAASSWGTSIKLDASGNIYTTGIFEGTSDFDPSAGVFNLNSAGSTDIFISKLDVSGNFVWAKSLGGAGFDFGQSIIPDAVGNSYITGYFVGTADFDPGVGSYNLTSAGLDDIFISKLDASGNFVWAKSMGGTNMDWAYSIAVDASSNVYTTGKFKGIADFDPGVGVSNLTSNGLYDIFISKLDASGNFSWAESIGGTNDDYAVSIALDATDNVFTTGYFNVTVDFDPGSGVSNLTSTGASDIFVCKMGQITTNITQYSNLNTQISIYPNPTNGMLNIKLKIINGESAQIQIINSIGQVVMEQSTETNNLTLNTNHLTSGVYYLKVKHNNEVEIFKVLKQ